MHPLDLFFHLINFALPAVFVALALAFASPLIWRQSTQRYSKSKTWFIGSLLGIAALIGGLWFYRVDGKIMTYSVMIGVQTLWQMWTLRRAKA